MKLTEQIHLLRIDFEIVLGPEKKIPRYVNVILIIGDNITLIDTGVKGSESLIFDYIKKQGRSIAEIETIILSHAHPDHIGSAAVIKEITGCKVLAHSHEKAWIEDIELQFKERPVPGFYWLSDRSVMLDGCIEDNQLIKLQEGLTLKCLKSSGHSKGDLNVLFIEDRILFTGDTIPVKNDIPNYQNYHELVQSLRRMKDLNGYETLLTSFTSPVKGRPTIEQFIRNGEDFMREIDRVVKKQYRLSDAENLENCRSAIRELQLPPFLVHPVVDMAFKSHLQL